jgi:hypothetical protein
MSYNTLKNTWTSNFTNREDFVVKNNRPAKICIVGGHQIGSTRVFNLVRVLHEKIGKKVLSLGPWDRPSQTKIKELGKGYDIILHKFHDIDIDYIKNYDTILLPNRNLLDAAMSAGIRWNKNSNKEYINHCHKNISRFNKFKAFADFVVKYEDYSIKSIKSLCKILKIDVSTSIIIETMKHLETMLNDANIIDRDDTLDKLKDEKYKKTILSKNHNTSGGAINKFIDLELSSLKIILQDKIILDFMTEHNYF